MKDPELRRAGTAPRAGGKRREPPGTSVPFLAQHQHRAGGATRGAPKLPDALSLSNLGQESAQRKTDSSDRFRNKRLNARGLEKTTYLSLSLSHTRAGNRLSG